MHGWRLLSLLCFAACAACVVGGGAVPPAPTSPPARCDYAVTMLSKKADLRVAVECDAPVQRFIASEGPMAHHIHLMLANGDEVERQGAHFALPRGTRRVEYRLDLDAVAAEQGNIDVARRADAAGRSAWIAAVSTWILRPDPASPDGHIGIRVKTPPGSGFASGMPRTAHGFEIRARDIRYATYGVFGDFTTERIELPPPLSLETATADHAPAVLELLTLPGALGTSASTRYRWVRDTARAIADFWRGFPVRHVVLVLIPTANRDEVVHGKVVATGGATVALFLGERAEEADLYGDWILVHELFHLGVPSFANEGKWLDEGLATYYEPIIRARAGWLTPHAVWSEFASLMAQGLPAVEGTGLEHTTTFSGIYWGGAIMALIADARIRERSGGTLGLEDGLRAVLALGGDATELWPLDRVISVIDERLGEPTLRPLADAHRLRGQPVDLPGLLRRLGVVHSPDGITLDDTAALAQVRKSILAPLTP